MSAQDEKPTETSLQARVFLERRSYRQRRLIDAARILPVVGIVLWFVPLVWPSAEENGEISTSSASTYIFTIWIGLIVVGALVAWRMAPADESPTKPSGPMDESAFETRRRDRTG
ncbi:hypothetical protein [Planktotalea sp.]|uniref:hypothetical protein n=1 Tax=Planktotalea sp. TaxID=2029877 RepID=UPI0025EA9E03|nr:hypothetical protein [Planktotalea sp.]